MTEVRSERRPVDLSPSSAYEVMTRQMVEDLRDDLIEIKGRLNGLIVMVAGALMVNIVLRLAGLV
jgi:hypothetical protein